LEPDEPERWKPIPSVPGHFASSLGRIRRPDYKKYVPGEGWIMVSPPPIYGTRRKSGRHQIEIRGKQYAVPRLVCEAFYGPAPLDKPLAIHIDEDASNSKISNLKWGDYVENGKSKKLLEYRRSRSGENSTWAEHYRRIGKPKW
jgi:hypothetical protein